MAIGNQWASAPVPHEGVPGQLHLRRIEPGMEPKGFSLVALAFLENPCEPSQAQRITATIQAQLESRPTALLVAAHYLKNGKVVWYAYAASRKALDDAFAILGQKFSLYLGVNEDPDWKEYKFMRGLVP